ncbi:tRNA (adenosine(37)-N6)-threonylcarbamoyltransferase complex dimerization subunit type 1 TsaB [Citromicrobium bathyomarinum]|uniref:tRNA (adenosine(37)-N6)-threonylcarbamoyltransferase complex dimerization subunit type 1 TsaB n=1 Tax=Citromicrobium bathyomarinum TaxID=72174 RepID=UPI00315A9948
MAIDCATAACSVALFAEGEMIAGEFHVLGRGHAERLVPMIAALPERGRATRIAVARGPGSFTGVRIGLAVARSLAFAWKAELVGYSTMALVAAMARARNGALPVTVAMEGGHGEWFVQGFDGDGRALAETRSLRPQDAVAAFPSTLVAGTVAEDFVARAGSGSALPLHSDAREFRTLPESELTPDAAPIYGRAPDAKAPSSPRGAPA